MSKIILVLLSLSISACSSISYKEPTEGPLSRVRFATETEGLTMVRNYITSDCGGEEEWMRLRNGFLLNSTPKKLGMPLWNHHENAAKEFLVTSNNDTYFMFSASHQIGRTTYSCGVPATVIFKENHDYEMLFKFGVINCSVILSEIINENGTYNKNTLNTYTNVIGANQLGCKKSFTKARWY